MDYVTKMEALNKKSLELRERALILKDTYRRLSIELEILKLHVVASKRRGSDDLDIAEWSDWSDDQNATSSAVPDSNK